MTERRYRVLAGKTSRIAQCAERPVRKVIPVFEQNRGGLGLQAQSEQDDTN